METMRSANMRPSPRTAVAVFAAFALAYLVAITLAEQSGIASAHMIAGPAYDCGHEEFPHADPISPQAVSDCIDALAKDPMDNHAASAQVKTKDRIVYCSVDCKSTLTLQQCQACVQTVKLLGEEYCSPTAKSATFVIGICSLVYTTASA